MLAALGFSGQSEAERRLMDLLLDETAEVISSLELNQFATFTYHEQSMAGGRMLYEKMLDILEKIISKPFDVSTLTIHKALVVVRHMLLFGAEKVLAPARSLGTCIHSIEENYNTAVMAQQATGASGFLMRLKGGAVDKGGPCRQLAKQINILLSNPHFLQAERSKHADQNSLVPVGSHQQVGFITDQARLEILKRRMDHQRKMEMKSNLAKSDAAFGSGYNSKDGKSIVGAAHSLDEMIAEAQRKERAKNQKFSDEPKPQDQQSGFSSFREYQAPSNDLLSIGQSSSLSAPANSMGDLLDFSAPAPVSGPPTNDLLGTDFTPTTNAPTMDIFAPSPVTAPPSNNGSAFGASSTGLGQVAPVNRNGLSGGPSRQADKFAALDALNPLGSGMPSYNLPQAQPPSQKPVLSMNSGGSSSLDSLSTGLSSFAISTPAPAQSAASSLRVSSVVNPISQSNNDDDDSGGFVMGGTVGTGLEPLGPAPGAPPPPPPAF